MRRFCSKHIEQPLAATVRHPVGFSQHSPIFLLHLYRATTRRSKTNVSTDWLRCYTNIINQKQRTRARGNPTVADIRGRKHRLQLAHSQRSVWKNKMCTTKHNMKYTDRNFFKTILQLSNSDSASGAYCRILCKPDG